MPEKNEFIYRNIYPEIVKHLFKDEITLITGPRQVGKTTIMRHLIDEIKKGEIETDFNEVFFVNAENPEVIDELNKHPDNLFSLFANPGKKSAYFIDEIQNLKDPSRFLKYIYDEYKGKVKLVVSGSSAFYIDKAFKDSLVGRKKIFVVETLFFDEFVLLKDEVLYKALENSPGLLEQRKLKQLFAEHTRWGGYPRVVLAENEDEKKEHLSEIGLSFVKKDAAQVGIKKPEALYKLLKLLAQQVGNLMNTHELANTLDISFQTAEQYIYLARKSFLLDIVRPISRNVRKEITKMPKAFFTDTGLRNFFANNFDALELRYDRGELFENSVYKCLRGKSDEIHFWRTADGKEVDFVLEKVAFEAKFSQTQIKNNVAVKTFREIYPEKGLYFVVYEKMHDDKSIIYPWEIRKIWS